VRAFVLAPGEGWIVDRMVEEWYAGNPGASVLDPNEADCIWLLAEWAWDRLPVPLLQRKKVLTTVHHVVPEKFGPQQRADFARRDDLTTAYHVFNQRTLDFVRPLTQRPIHLVPYWANQVLWRPTRPRSDIRRSLGLPMDGYLIGSFQRDTEGHDLRSPKREKGPDLLCDYLEGLRDQQPKLFVVLAGWRRQYVQCRLARAGIPYAYFERPSLDVVNDLYQNLDLYPVTARHEGGPQALIECGLLGVPVVSRPVGIAEQVLPASAIHDDVSRAVPAVPDVEAWKLPGGFEPYRRLLGSL
jgi:hypothetical protein